MTIHLFAEISFAAFSRQLQNEAISRIRSEKPDYLLNVNESEYLAHLESEISLEQITFLIDQISMDAEEQMVPAGRFPAYQFGVSRGASYKRQVFTFHVPFSGNAELLRCQPSQVAVLPGRVQVNSDEINFQIVNLFENADRVKQEKEQILKSLQTSAASLASEVTRHNAGLSIPLRSEFEKRKTEILKQRQIAESIGVPIRKKSVLAQTFSVLVTSRKKVTPKPRASTEPFVQEPVLDNAEHF
jgi:hypothetical protein